MERLRVAEAAKGVGRPKVGGPFELLDQHGKAFSSEEMKGKHSLVCTFPPYNRPPSNP
jgi:protein SCO1/2